MKTLTKWASLAALLAAFLVALGCASSSSNPAGSAGSGTMSLALTDDAIDDLNITQVWLTIARVSVHRETGRGNGDWIDVLPNATVTGPVTVDVLQLRNGVTRDLGLNSLPAGHYTQVRLRLGNLPEGGTGNPHPLPNYVVASGIPRELVLPSGAIKLNHTFTINAGANYDLTLDFDVASSVHCAGGDNHAKYVLRPTIGLIETDDPLGTLGGQVSVTGVGCPSPQGMTVMAEVQDDPADPSSLRVVRKAVVERVDDTTGRYTLPFLPPGTYTLVAYKDDPSSHQVVLAVEPGVVVAAGEQGHDLAPACYPRTPLSGTVALPSVPDRPDETVPLVTVYAAGGDGLNFILTVTGAPYDKTDYSYSFSVGVPGADAGLSFEASPDMGTLTLSE